ncbi:type III-B CRISPR-associated protein Cas10/Cmr2 [Halotia wernerae UHCC 0503]|nr:type III-B CRISPR-associated protein Cas10/Cmr2 [Halotia wernerae UHCC 0503]
MVNVSKYTAITFAPVQGFIEKSRKLRDLYGASLILSYLSQKLVKEAKRTTTVISPAIPNLQKGMPNRILIKGEFSQSQVEQTLLSAWKEILHECRTWIEKKLPDYKYHWEREWTNWGNHTWEIFWAQGNSIQKAMNNLETCKLSRGWTAVNWIGESSSLTGTDGIAFPGLGGEARNPKFLSYHSENEEIKDFYKALAAITKEPGEDTPEGKFIAPNEKLSIPELVKRLVMWDEIREKLGIERLDKSFKEIQRKPQPTENIPGQWTGWFMGDGDKVGEHLKNLAAKENGDEEIQNFSESMHNWGKEFSDKFNLHEKIGRIVYAGGDDFLGIIYSKNPAEPISPLKAFEWLTTLNGKWEEHKQPLTVSVGFVWVAGSVPQRDVLQHCREAQKLAKSLGRDRVTIRIVFNSGQYVQWTCPWNYLDILTKYQDREGQANWSHIYQDLAQLESRRAFNIDKKTYTEKFAIDFFDIYFPGEGKDLLNYERAKYLVGFSDEDDSNERAKATVEWINDLIKVGWHLSN